jgi:thioredoxin-like negative regulator of GroEL
VSQHARPVALGDGEDLDDLLVREETVLLELYTSGCGICASMEPVLGVVARQVDATVATVNAGDDLALVDRFDVRRVPTLVLFRDGEAVAQRDEGFVGADELVAWVESGGE